MTYLDAEKSKLSLDMEQSKKLCPLIVGNCVSSCVCYLGAEIVDDEGNSAKDLNDEEKIQVGESWEVIDPYCRCYFLFGRRM